MNIISIYIQLARRGITREPIEPNAPSQVSNETCALAGRERQRSTVMKLIKIEVTGIEL